MKSDKQKAHEKGMIVGACPLCDGKGKIRKEIPPLANPKAPMTRAERMSFKVCPKCHGSGRISLG